MDALNRERKHELIRRVFPDLRYGGDPDIERYFELRRDRRLSDALTIYNSSLRARYPDDAARIELLRLYREGDPRYASYQETLILQLAEKLALRIAANIDLIIGPLERADLSNAFSALKAVESVLARFGGDSEVALAQLARYEEFSRILDHRSPLSRRALELVREYDAVARADSPADYDFIARSEAIERRRAGSGGRISSSSTVEESYDFVAKSREREAGRRERKNAQTNFFDPSRITFKPEDRARVEIPATLRRREDKVLVYCTKYWNQVRDPAFDRLVFLYSRKYGSAHYEIFRAIKLGRQRGSSDDEILSAVSGILTTSYDYSVSGDLYMQVMWRRLRMRMEARAIEHRLAAPGPESLVRAAHAERRKVLDSSETESRVRKTGQVSAESRSRGAELEASSAPGAASRVRRIRPARPAEAPGAQLPAGASAGKAGIADTRSPARGGVAPASAAATSGAAVPTPHAAPPAAPHSAPPVAPTSHAAPTPGFATRAPDFALRNAIARAASERRSALPIGRSEPAPVERKVALPPSSAPGSFITARSAKRKVGSEAVEPSRAQKTNNRPTTSRPAVPTAAQPVPSAARAAVRDEALPGPGASLTKASKTRRANLLAAIPAAPEPVPRIESRGGSISDRIRALSGKAYDVYREIFLENVRTFIHRHLLANQTKSHGIFDTAANEAEDQIFGFIAAHYDDPFMDWERSAERVAVESFGFALPSLDPIIEACFRRL